MAAQQGRLLLLKIGDGATSEAFTALGGLKSNKITLNEAAVDVTNADSSGAWRELLAGAGIKSMSISGSGVFKDSVSENRVVTDFMAGTIRNYQIVIPALGTFQGAFHLDSVDYDGTHDGEVTYSVSLSSAGQITFAGS